MKERLDGILKDAVNSGVSDIHLTVGVPPTLRLNGDLVSYGEDILTKQDTEAMAQAIVPLDKWETFKEKGELDFSYAIEGLSRFRVNSYHQSGKVGLAIRTIPTEIPTLEKLNLPDLLKDMMNKKQGLILVTGPTGSGKSTTLAAMLNYVNMNYGKHILTLEDPIEFVHNHKNSIVNQREVGFDTQSFSNGLRAALREDPDIILVGEMRDFETVSTALTAAETGHLVLGTLHTTGAPETVDRLIDVFPHEQQSQVRVQLASVIAGVISQRLLPTLDGKGRTSALEIMVATPAISNMIRTEKVHQIKSAMETGKQYGMQTMADALKTLVNKGKITQEVANMYVKTE